MMEWIKVISLMIEYLAVAIIAGMVGYSTVRYFIHLIRNRNAQGTSYRQYKNTLGAALLLGLEILVAADVIRTVALEPTIENIAALGLLVVVRTFLSWSIVVEVEGHWPWSKKHTSEEPGEHS
jgi:uncharacterized membrane protein